MLVQNSVILIDIESEKKFTLLIYGYEKFVSKLLIYYDPPNTFTYLVN